MSELAFSDADSSGFWDELDIKAVLDKVIEEKKV